MDLSTVKKLSQNGERVILVENGEPTLVLLPFTEYDRMMNGAKQASIFPENNNSSPEPDFGNNSGAQEVIAKQEQYNGPESTPEETVEEVNFPSKSEEDSSKGGLTLEDLPF